MTSPTDHAPRRLPIGAELLPGGASFRVWAPKRREVAAVVTLADGRRAELPLAREGNGYFSTVAADVVAADVTAGAQYGFRLDRGERVYADPASRFQPDGTDGLSEVIDPRAFSWTDQKWPGVKPPGQVIYELHVGTFTPEGTWAAAIAQLPELARAGMTLIEVMPLAEFPGKFGWGYDGVYMFSPTRLYGRPDDFRQFVDRAHALGVGVILDVVYNHFGSVGNYLREFSDFYFSKTYGNEWSEALNFDDRKSGPVREFFEANARYWIEEFHLDGFRFDATHAIHDASSENILAAVARTARDAAAPRTILLAAENGPQDVRQVKPQSAGGFGLDMIWNDDFHHAARVRTTGTNEGYYWDFLGAPQEFIATARRGFVYQGQFARWQGSPRGTPTTGLPAAAFVTFLENHDQVANSATGQRPSQLASPGVWRAMTTLWLLSPQTPMFFQGQEFGATTPFMYFADFSGREAKGVATGRANFLKQFPSLATPEAQARLPNPADPAIFQQCKLNLDERTTRREQYDLHIDLLALRRDDAVFRQQQVEPIDGAVLSADCLVLRYFGHEGDDRLLLVNFGRDLLLTPVSEPLLAPPAEREWSPLWSSADAKYGGGGAAPIETEEGWRIPGETGVVLVARVRKKTNSADKKANL